MYREIIYSTLPPYQDQDPMGGNLGAEQHQLMHLNYNQITLGNTQTHVLYDHHVSQVNMDTHPTALYTPSQRRAKTIARRVIGGTMIAGGVGMVGYGSMLMLAKDNNSSKNNSTTSSKNVGTGLIIGGVVLAALGGLIISPRKSSVNCADSAEACCHGVGACLQAFAG